MSLTVWNGERSDTLVRTGYITVLRAGAPDRIRSLKEYVSALPGPGWTQWFLTSPLDRSLDQLEKGHAKPAISQMETFVRFVDMLDRFGIITPSQVRYMKNEAAQIIGSIQAESPPANRNL